MPKPAQVGTVAETTECYAIVDAAAYYAAFYEAAQKAQHYILITGWQFDTEVELIRGPRAVGARYPVKFLEFLNALCEQRPALRIYILAWDYSVVYSLEREWLQSLRFAFQASSAIHFQLDTHPHYGGAHHQKLVVVDDAVAFVGGMDICDARWDERDHRAAHALRYGVDKQLCRPNHEVQSAVRGPVVRALVELFLQRWHRATDKLLELPHSQRPAATELDLRSIDRDAILPLTASELSILRTEPRTQRAPGVFEVKRGFIDALRSADELIYIETQYFTSRSITAAMVERMQDETRPKLQVAIVVPRSADNSKEAFALGDLHNLMLAQLQTAAKEHGHELYVLCSVGGTQSDSDATFIHSKLLLVDDVYLCIGSANMTERSMGFDTELCLVWSSEPDSALSRDLRRLRRSLLAEHAGHPVTEDPNRRMSDEIREWLESSSSRLRTCQYEATSPNAIKSWIFDPGGPADLEEAREDLAASQSTL